MIPDKIPVLFILLDYTNYLNKLIIFVFQKIEIIIKTHLTFR